MTLNGIWIKSNIKTIQLEDVGSIELEYWVSHADQSEIRIIVSKETKKEIISKLISLGLPETDAGEIRRADDLDYIILWR